MSQKIGLEIEAMSWPRFLDGIPFPLGACYTKDASRLSLQRTNTNIGD